MTKTNPQKGKPSIWLHLDEADLRDIQNWRDRIGLKTTQGAIKLAIKAGMSVLAYQQRKNDPEASSAFVLRLSRSEWTRLLEASRTHGRSMRDEAMARLNKSFEKSENEKGGAPASETRSASSKSQPER